jgi:hypothetical protein
VVDEIALTEAAPATARARIEDFILIEEEMEILEKILRELKCMIRGSSVKNVSVSEIRE